MPDGLVMVVNAEAGSAARKNVEAAREVLAARRETSVVETGAPEDIDRLVADLGERLLVICGGDGSIHVTVDRLRRLDRLDDVLLGLIPLGTGNDLARTLGIPLEPDDAARTLLDASARPLDLIVAEDGAFAVNSIHAGVGVDAALLATGMKPAMGPLAYPLGAIAAAAGADGWEVEVTVDGTRLQPRQDGAVLLVSIMNSRTFGGGTPMAPDAQPDDGLLDVVVSTATGPARATFGVALHAGAHLDRDDVAIATGSEVTITGDPIGYNIDGELEVGEPTSRTFRVEPQAWRLLAPVRGR